MNRMDCLSHRLGAAVCAAVLGGAGQPALAGEGDDAFADAVISFVPGQNPAPGYDNPQAALGTPHRLTGECFGGLDVISAFTPAYCFDEIVSLGAGGQLIVRFDTPVLDDPNNLYGIDLLVFGNTTFSDASYPDGIVAGLLGNEGGNIDVSLDGSSWTPVPGAIADGPWPTVGYVDADPFAHAPGEVLTDFTRPIDPALDPLGLNGMTNAQVMELYRGSGGGVGIDLSDLGLAAIQFVRITNPAQNSLHVEVDAFADVTPRLPGDVTLDGTVNVSDLLAVINAWGATTPGGVPADFNHDGAIDVSDLLVVINNWGLSVID